jgi:hypothetical protein
MAATAQAQAEATKEAQRAGIAHAKANGDARAYKGRKPSYSRKQFEKAMLGKSASVGEVTDCQWLAGAEPESGPRRATPTHKHKSVFIACQRRRSISPLIGVPALAHGTPQPQRASCYPLTSVNDCAHAIFWTTDDLAIEHRDHAVSKK